VRIKSINIEDYLPLLCWENDCIISKAADITVPLTLQLPQVYSIGAEEFEALHQMWVRAIKILPDYSIVHKQDWFFSSKYVPVDSGDSSFLEKASNNHFRSRRFLQHKSFLFLTQSSSKNYSYYSCFSALCSGRLINEERLDDSVYKAFMDSVEQFCSILKENGIVCRRLTKKEVIGEPGVEGLIERYISLNLGSTSKCHLSDIAFDGFDTKVGDNYLSLFSISDLNCLPSKLYTHLKKDKFSTESTTFNVGFTHSLGFDLPFDHIYNQYIFLEPHKKIIGSIEKRGREQQSLSKISRENAINKEFNDSFLNESVISGRRAVYSAENVMLWDSNYLSLLKKNSLVGSVLANMDCTAVKTEGIVPQLLWGGIPGAASQFPNEMRFLTFLEQACCFFYNEGAIESVGSNFGVRLCDRIFGIPLNVDLSDYPRQKGWIDNRNKFILGPSGSGKSFFTNHLVRSYYMHHTHVVIVDIGDSYQGLANLINEQTNGRDGVYFKYCEDNPISFNPFYVSDGIYSVEKREQLASLIFCLWKNESEVITKAEETHISVAINGYVESLKNGDEMASFDGFYNYLSNDFRKKLKIDGVKRCNFDIDNLLQILAPYYVGGMYHYLLNAKENIDLLNKRFIVFEIDSIKDHKTLFPVVTLVLMDTFISKMRHPSLAMDRKMILIEEAWKAISKNGTAHFIKYLYKTVRKHFGEAIVVSQEVDDIIGNDIIKEAIISNADCKILLDQRKYSNRFSEIKETLALSEKESAIALSVNRDLKTNGRSPYKEVFITLNGNFSSVYAVEVSKSEYLTYTTEKREKEELLKRKNQCGSLMEAIKQMSNIEK